MSLWWIEVDKIDVKSKISIWSLKMTTLLSHHDLKLALKNDDKWGADQKGVKPKIQKQVMNLQILCLSYNVL